MATRLVASAAVVVLTASVAVADVNLVYSPTDVPVGTATEIEMSLVANTGLDTTIGAVIVDFGPGSDLADLDLTAFEFNDVLTSDSWTWEVTLPNVVQTVWGGALGGGPALHSEQTIPIGTFMVEPMSLGSFTLDANLEMFNSSDFADLVVKSGDPTTFRVVPEPASLALLALGASALIRRRRR